MITTIIKLEEKIGEKALVAFLNTFSCLLNPEVDHFLKHKALQSARLAASQTHLVIDDTTCQLLGYYTLVLKAYSVAGAKLNASNRRLISRFAQEDADGNFYAPVFLIAQLGKNYAIDEGSCISGKELIGMALDEFRSIKTHIGGKLVMVEREKDHLKLQTFYQKNGFKSWTSRINEDGDTCYDQMFAVI